jgi:replication-associated recombination protein RarA
MSTNLLDQGASSPMQSRFTFPESLSDKYKPKRVADFLVAFPRNVMLSLLRNPKPSAWFFLGPSGLGKTEMAMAFGNELPAHVYHIASKDCDLAKVRWIKDRVKYVPGDIMKPGVKALMYLFIVDEADSMTRDAVDAFLSLLDASGRPNNAIFIFTGNAQPNDPSGRFMSRVKMLPFSKEGMSGAITALLASVWEREGGSPENAPNFARLVKDSKNNIRDAINVLEIELMAIEACRPC